jgi:RNA polymerase-interacting CarD/CdnL/TRCF family regulator
MNIRSGFSAAPPIPDWKLLIIKIKEFMKKTGMNLKKGDWIVHAYHGLGQVMGFSSKMIGGEKSVCLEMKTATLTCWLPIPDSGINHIRLVSTPSNFEEALMTISALPDLLDDDYRVRTSYINEEIAKGSLISRAKIIRDINGGNVRKSIEFNEKSTLQKLKLQFVEELMVVCHLNKQTAETKLDKALQKSSESLRT